MTAVAAAAVPVRRRRTVRQFVPPQHGAWAMLLVPYVCGVAIAGFAWPDVPLFGAWLAGYLFSYYALQWVKVRRWARLREQLLLYGGVVVVLGGVVVVARPAVLLYAPLYALLLAANAGFARQRRDRALVNDLVSVVGSCLMVFVAATVAGAPLRDLAVAFVACLLYFAGTVLHVKTMIRERGSVRYHRASVAYHAVALGAAVLLGPALALVFALLLARAIVFPWLTLTPKRVGITEIVASVLLVVAVLMN
jgi:hypothetical protein